MRSITLTCLGFAALFCPLLGVRAQAQSGYTASQLERIKRRNSASRYSTRTVQNQVAGRSVTATGVFGVNRNTYISGSSLFGGSKPFKQLNRGPSVSPYLALSGSLNGVSDYYNIVRPQQRQTRENARLQRQTMANQRRLNQIAAQGPYNIRGDPNLAPTGHAATYMHFENFQSTGNYFPAPQGLRKENP